MNNYVESIMDEKWDYQCGFINLFLQLQISHPGILKQLVENPGYSKQRIENAMIRADLTL